MPDMPATHEALHLHPTVTDIGLSSFSFFFKKNKKLQNGSSNFLKGRLDLRFQKVRFKITILKCAI
jgi:hypothetical protein